MTRTIVPLLIALASAGTGHDRPVTVTVPTTVQPGAGSVVKTPQTGALGGGLILLVWLYLLMLALDLAAEVIRELREGATDARGGERHTPA